MFKEYYRLAKPGIVYGNVFTTLAAFLYASRWHFNSSFFLATMIGISLVIASACVFNNYIDRDIDAKMSRTKDRALVARRISKSDALIYGVILGILGIFILYVFVNTLTTLVALVGFVFYVFIYTYSKRKTHWSTVIGSIPGATPILVGYTAITDRIDLSALILFLILVFWQMPHFYAIAIRRIDEYRAAGIPTLPIVKGIRRTKIEIVFYIVALIIATCALSVLGFAGLTYRIVMLILGIAWLVRSMRGFNTADDTAWAKNVFLFSLIVLMGFSIALALSPFLA